jgi:hypothetical protein
MSYLGVYMVIAARYTLRSKLGDRLKSSLCGGHAAHSFYQGSQIVWETKAEHTQALMRRRLGGLHNQVGGTGMMLDNELREEGQHEQPSRRDYYE